MSYSDIKIEYLSFCNMYVNNMSITILKYTMNNNMNNNMTHFECVGEFHTCFGHPMRTKEYFECLKSDTGLIPFRLKMIDEELNELKEAFDKNDYVEIADALCDVAYFIFGSGHCLGFNVDQMLKQHNMSIDTPNELNRFDVNEFNNNRLDYALSITKLFECLNDLQKKYDEMNKSFSDEDFMTSYLFFVEFCNMMIYLLNDVYSLGHRMSFNMDLLFREVHRSNMSKLCSTEEDAQITVQKYNQGTQYKNTGYRYQNGYYVVYDVNTSKILKNHKWSVPMLKNIIA